MHLSISLFINTVQYLQPTHHYNINHFLSVPQPTSILTFGNSRFSILSISHSMAAGSPLSSCSLIAVTGQMAQLRLISASLSRWLSCQRLTVAMSRLLAITRTTAYCMSGWVIMRLSYFAARSMRSLSELSITQIRARALSKQCVQRLRNFSCPPTSQTINLIVLKFSSQTLKPIVGIVLITSPSFSEQRIVVLPAPSRPSITTLHCFFGIFLVKSDLKILPIIIIHTPTQIHHSQHHSRSHENNKSDLVCHRLMPHFNKNLNWAIYN